MSYTVGQIAALLGLNYQGDGACQLKNAAKRETADEASLIFLEGGDGEILHLYNLRAACVIAPKELLPNGINAIFSSRPKLDFARAAAWPG